MSASRSTVAPTCPLLPPPCPPTAFLPLPPLPFMTGNAHLRGRQDRQWPQRADGWHHVAVHMRVVLPRRAAALRGAQPTHTHAAGVNRGRRVGRVWQRWFACAAVARACCMCENSGRAGGIWGGEGRVCWEWHGERRARRVWEQSSSLLSAASDQLDAAGVSTG